MVSKCWSSSCGNPVEPTAVACAACGERLLIADKYRIRRMLGQGGMGIVYVAHDEALGRDVAVKVMHGRYQGQSKHLERFRTECRAMAALDHPSIARIYDADTHHEQLFVVQELVRGKPLREWMSDWFDGDGVSLVRAVRVAVDLLDALHHAHERGIVHRDVNPNNVLLVERDGALQPVLIDFGMARTANQETTKVAWGGTPGYVAPEQLLDPASNDRRSDLYSVGAVLYAMLALGEVPYAAALEKGIGDRPKALLAAYERIASGHVPLARPADMDDALFAATSRALQPDPAGRFQRAAEMARALAPFDAGRPALNDGDAHTPSAANSTAEQTRPDPSAGTSPSTISALAESTERTSRENVVPRKRWLLPGALGIASIAGAAIFADRLWAPIPAPSPSAMQSSALPTPTPTTLSSAAPESAETVGRLTLYAPSDAVAMHDGSIVIADRGNHRIVSYANGKLSVLAGDGVIGFADGPAARARFNDPRTVRVGSDGAILVADEGNHRIRAIRGEKVETFAGSSEPGLADGAALHARFNHPTGLAVRADGGVVVADSGNHCIRLVKDGQVTTIAGTGKLSNGGGPALKAGFATPANVAVGPDGAVYITDAINQTVSLLKDERVTELVKLPKPTTRARRAKNAATLKLSEWLPPIAVAPDGTFYVVDPDEHQIRQMKDQKVVRRFGSGNAGSVDADAPNATFMLPQGLTLGPHDTLLVADVQANAIRSLHEGHVTTIGEAHVGGTVDGQRLNARFDRPSALAFDSNGRMFIADWDRVRVLGNDGEVSTFAGLGGSNFFDGPRSDAEFDGIWDLKVGPKGVIYLADGDNHRIRVIEGDEVRTLAGSGIAGYLDGDAESARFNEPSGIAVSKQGDVYVADTLNHRIRLIKDGQVTTFAGTGVPGFDDNAAASARFNRPSEVELDGSDRLYVADTENNRIRMVLHGQVSTVAGSGQAGFADGDNPEAQFNGPTFVAVDHGKLFVADAGNHRVRVIEKGQVSTLAGAGVAGYADGAAAKAWFTRPTCVVPSPDGAIYVVDAGNHLIRMIFDRTVSTYAGIVETSVSPRAESALH